MSTREVHLINRPVGLPNDECFDIVEVELPTPEDGQVSVQNLFFSVCLLYTSPSPRDS